MSYVGGKCYGRGALPGTAGWPLSSGLAGVGKQGCFLSHWEEQTSSS